jgi:hypothetical protein
MKVVCIAGLAQVEKAKALGGVVPVRGKIYTIREIRDDAQWRHGEHHLVLLLQEIDNCNLIGKHVATGLYCYVEPGYSINCFRPVQARKTSIEVFTRMLNPQKQEERA